MRPTTLTFLLLAATLAHAEPPAEPPARIPEAPGAQEASQRDRDALALDRWLAEERRHRQSRFTLTPHRPNYIMPFTYLSTPSPKAAQLDPWEVKFQISFKVHVTDDFLGTGGDLQFAYTQQSYWQAFNNEISAPFRETNYEPEIMLRFIAPQDLGAARGRMIVAGISHQSNGRTQPDSRSWNRAYLDFVFQRERNFYSFKPWFRFPERAKSSPLDPDGDDNPDIGDYMGYFELNWTHVRGPHRYGLMLRNNLEEDNHGAVQIDWAFPIRGRLMGYVQYFNGYGESLIDYDFSVNRVGIGLMLNHWL